MKTIYKYPIETTDRQEIQLPKGAQILSVQTQHSNPVLWALVNTDAQTQSATIITYGTGHAFREEAGNQRFLGTYQLHNGSLVFHVFLVEATA